MEYLIGSAVVALLATVVGSILRLVKRQKEALARSLRQAGFHPVPHLDPALSQEFVQVMHKQDEKAELKEVFCHSGMDYDLYRFEVNRKSDDNSRRYAMVFRQSIFPAFALMPHLNLPALLRPLVDRLFTFAIGRTGLKEVEVHGRPQFQERFRLYALDPHTLKHAIENETWSRLTAIKDPIVVQGRGRVLVIQDLAPMTGKRKQDPATELRAMVDHAESLSGIFRELKPYEEPAAGAHS